MPRKPKDGEIISVAKKTVRSPLAMASAKNPGDGSRRLINERHEQFARAVAIRGMSHADAARSLYDEENKWTHARASKEGHRLACCTETIVARIQWLTDQVILREAKVVETTREWVTQEMVATYQGAIENGQYTAAVKALELLGTEHGMFIRRTQSQIVDERTPIEASSREELADRFVQLARDAFGNSISAHELRRIFQSSTGVEIEVVEPVEPAKLEANTPPVGSA